MTLAEIIRAIESKKRVQLLEAKQKAINDYQLADMIGRSIARIYSSSAQMPEISEVYPSLFDSEEIEEQRQKKKDELTAARFRQFAQIHNSKLKEEGKNNV